MTALYNYYIRINIRASLVNRTVESKGRQELGAWSNWQRFNRILKGTQSWITSWYLYTIALVSFVWNVLFYMSIIV